MFRDLKNRIHPSIIPGLVVASALPVWMLGRGFVAQSAAIFAMLLALPSLYHAVKPGIATGFDRLRPGVRRFIVEGFPYAVVVVGTLIALGPVALGQMPVSQDHANHYFATHILVHELVPSGRFFGWTDAFGTGYPYGDTYHTPSYLFTGLLYLLSFGTIPLSVSYAFGIVLAWLIPAVAVTAWTRRIAGPVGAMVAGLAFALDMGSDREGGWVYAMFHGVWAQHVGTGVLVLALLGLIRLMEKPTTRRLAAAVLTAGISMWLHPMNSLMLLIASVLLFVLHYLTTPSSASDEARQKLLLMIPALAAAGIIGLVWVVRMMLAGDVVYASAAYWRPLEQLMLQLLNGALMENQLALVSVLGLIGLIQLAVAGGRFRTFTWLLPAVCILIGSMALILESDVGLAGGKLGIMQYRRFSVAAKPFWYAMSGAGVSAVGMALTAGLRKHIAANRAARVLFAAVFAPFLSAALSAFPGLFLSPVAMPLTLARTGDADNLAKLEDALMAEAEKCPESGCRAVYYEKPGHGGLYPVIAMADAGFAWQPTLSLPANNFEWLNPTMDVDTMARRGVSVIISKWALRHERLAELGTFGRHHLYRVSGAAPERAKMEGSGRAEIVSWAPSKRVIRVQGAEEGAGLWVFQPPYRKWHAEQSGKSLEITRRNKAGQVFSFIDAVGNGEVTLEYKDTTVENAITVLGMLLICLCVAGIVLKPRPIPVVLSPRLLRRLCHVFGVGAAALLVLGPVGMLVGGKIAARVEWLSAEPKGAALMAVLHQRNPDHLRFAPEHHCVPAYVRNPEFGCSERALLPYLAPAARRRGKIPSCLSVGIVPKGETTLTYRLPHGTTHVKGRLHQQGPGVVTGRTPDHSLGKAVRGGHPFEIPVAANEESITITLDADQQARACLELVAIQRP